MRMTGLAVGLIGLSANSLSAQTAPEVAQPAPVQTAQTTDVAGAPVQTTTPAPEAAPAPAAAPIPAVVPAPAETAGEGKIILYRGSSVIGAGIACPIRYEGKEIVELARGKYAEWAVNPGHYVLTNKTSSVDVAVGPGETRYVRCMIKPGFWVGRADLQIADQASFNEHSKEFEKKPTE